LPAGRAPQQVAGQHTVGEVQGALVGDDVGHGEQQRLVVHEEPHGLGVGDVDDGLAHPGQAEGLLGCRIGQVSWKPLMKVPWLWLS
jgi:hypothetical protein